MAEVNNSRTNHRAAARAESSHHYGKCSPHKFIGITGDYAVYLEWKPMSGTEKYTRWKNGMLYQNLHAFNGPSTGIKIK